MEFALARPPGHPNASPLELELRELAVDAGAWFDPLDDDTRAALARLERVLASSSLVDLARPDRANLALLRMLAKLPAAEWDDAHVFAGVALAALDVAADGLDDDAYALRYLTAGRDALRLAELAHARRQYQAEQTGAAAIAKRDRHADALERFAVAWRELGTMKADAKKLELARRFDRSEKTVERWHAEARAAGLL